jgi:phosphoglucomutase
LIELLVYPDNLDIFESQFNNLNFQFMIGVDASIKNKIDTWLNGAYDAETKSEIQKLIDQQAAEELTDAFYKDLEFGTGGLRGIMGVGSNRMNKYTVGMATQGLCNYLKQVFPGEQIRFVIAYDNRNNSTRFASIVANVCSSNGFEVFFFESLRPTPELSFAIRHLNCHSGVMLTASHNPKEYNGYKAYWSDGGQVTTPHDKNIITEVKKITSIDQVLFEGDPDKITTISSDVDTAYLDAISKYCLEPETVKKQKDLKIVFSPIHGTGITMVPQALGKWGFENIHIVEEQAVIDGNFPTVIYPNPEEEEAMKMALEKGQAIQADIIMATDPDGDRVGVGVKNNHGAYKLLNGNQICSLIVNYVLDRMKHNDALPSNGMVIKTIVTTDLIREISDSFGVRCHETLTGFKHIGALITAEEGKQQFLAGGEESYGYLIGDLIRDKDAVISCAMLAEMTAFYKEKDMSLFDALLELYGRFGYYKEKLISLTKKGKSGAEEIKSMMDGLRNNPPPSLGGSVVNIIRDYENRIEFVPSSGARKSIELPKSDVLQFITHDGTIVSARPSGTEPKIKFYCSVKENLNSAGDFDKVSTSLENKLENVMKDLLGEGSN